MSTNRCNLSPPWGFIGFEFDMNYTIKLKKPFINPDTTKAYKKRLSYNNIPDKTSLSKHDGYNFSFDGNRIELATIPFAIDPEGEKKFHAVFDDMFNWLENNLINQYYYGKGNKKRRKLKREIIDYEEFGRASVLGIYQGSWTYVEGPGPPLSPSFPIALAYPVMPLNLQRKPYFTENTELFASPQATITLPLDKIPRLVEEIRKREGNKAGYHWTGGSGTRQGVRSDALFLAYDAVKKEREELIKQNTVVTLSSGVDVVLTEQTFSTTLFGFLILVVQYLRITTIRYSRTKDTEKFAKAYVPLHLKSPFQKIHECILSDLDKELFNLLFAKGDIDTRTKLFKLAGKGEDFFEDSARFLFPQITHPLEKVYLDLSNDDIDISEGNFTWQTFIDKILNHSEINLRPVDLYGHEQKETRHDLFTSLTRPIGPHKTKDGNFVITVELRRLGFNWVHYKKWKSLCSNLLKVARALNTE